MNCSKEFFLGCLGGVDGSYPHNTLLAYDLALYNNGEEKPFGELFTKNGHSILRVGNDIETNGFKVIV